MLEKLLKHSVWLVALLLLGSLSVNQANAQGIGGPYEVDDNTLLLMHFDGSLDNVSDSSGNGTAHGTISYSQPPKDGLGNSARIENDAPSDSSFITIPHTDHLSLTGSWTIEGWINIFTFGTGSDSYKWVPRLLNKPGEDAFYTGNYYMEMWGSGRYFKQGYHTTASGSGQWIEVDSPENLMEVGSWYHWAYIRDAENNVMISLIHELQSDGSMEMVFFGVNPYDPISESPPLTNDNDLHIGFAGGGGDSFLDGWVDEIRISNIVRNYEIPPVFTSTDQLDNQETGMDYEVSASAYKLGESSTVSEVKVHYSVNEGTWQEVALAEDAEGTFTGSIPEQSTGATVDYYYSATGSDGLTAYFPNTAVTDSNYLSFGVVDPQSQTLSLSFEEGDGTPVDSSSYSNTIETQDTVEYSQDAAAGDYSLDLAGDSAMVISDSPFYSSTEMQFEMWFKPDSIPANETRLAINAGSPWWQSNFEIKFRAAGTMSGGSYVPGISDPTPFIMDAMVMDSTVEANTWHKIIYQVNDDSAIVQLFNENEVIIDDAVFQIDDNDPILTGGPLYIGGVGGSDTPFFDGKIDNVRLYNYAKDELTITAIEDQPNDLPKQVYLGENYPNPFNPSTTIRYNLPTAQDVTLKVYDVLGREVATLVDGVKQSGRHQATFDARGLASGVYLYKLQTKQTSLTKKMLLVK